ncbi:multidrug resistance protein homolog 49-like [Arctopsyche grandis]|uniref:multidrug resistance protein homolog 49-like n=1 Tax=Arctopsyche grandis TaxID=121162 RepID=UPI00406D6429
MRNDGNLLNISNEFGNYRRRSSTFSGPNLRGSLTSIHLQELNLPVHEKKDKEAEDPVPYYKIFRFAKCTELLATFLGIFMAMVMGACIPIGIIGYGEFTTLMMDRVAPKGSSTPTVILQAFGGGRIITNGTADELRDALIEDAVAFGVSMTAVSLLQLFVGILCIDLLNFSAIRQISRIRRLLLRSILCQDITWYDTNTSMNFATKISEDMEKLKEGIGEKIGVFTYLLTSFFFSILVSLFYGWKLTLVVMSCAPVIILTTALVARIQSTLTTRELKAYNMAGVIAEEVLSSIRTVVAFGGEKKEVERFSKNLRPAQITGSKKGLYSGIASGVMWLIIYVSYAVGFYYGVTLILDDRNLEVKEYTPAVFLIVFFGVLAGAQNMGLTSPHMEAFSTARSSAASIYKLIDRISNIDSLSTAGLKPNTMKGEIVFEDVHFRYPSRPTVKILQGFSLKIEPGQIVALVGPSGCGKSTCLQLIQRLYDPINGSVGIDGQNIKNLNVKWLRSHIGVVNQEPVLFSTTIKENIRYGRPGSTQVDVEYAAKSANCHDFIMKLPNGYDTMVGERGTQLSGGQKQRIAIARALIRDPKILLLDEATSALDLQSEAKVQKALDTASQGRTTIIVAHRLSTIANADIIVYMDKGIVVEMGSHAELMKLKGSYYNLVVANVEPKPNEDGQKSALNNNEEPSIKSSQASICSTPSLSTETISSVEENGEIESMDIESGTSFWRLMKLNMPEWPFIVLGCLASLVLGGTLPAFAILFGNVYAVLSMDDIDEIMRETYLYCVYFLILGVVTGLGIFTQIYVFSVSGAKLTSRLRSMSFEALLKQEMGWYDDTNNSIGALGVRLSSDCGAIQGATGSRIGSMIQAISTLAVGVVLSFFYSWKMTLVSLVTVPIILATVFLEARIMGNQGTKEKLAMESSTKIATEAISNIRTVISLCQEEGFIDRYIKEAKLVSKAARVKTRLRGVVFSLGQSSPYFGYALALYYGGVLVANKEIEFQNVIIVSEALIFGSWMIGQALAFAPNVNNAKISSKRIFALLDRIPNILSNSNIKEDVPWKSEGDIQYTKVEFHYPTRPQIEILQGLSLSIQKGQTVALVGHSGCGKSTCIQMLQRLYDPHLGSVRLDNKNIIEDLTLPKLRSQLGIVSQEPVLFDRTIAENIAYGDNSREVPMDEIIEAAKNANIHGFIRALPAGYNTGLGSKGMQLSGGQKQRIAIARALIRNPRILLLDEATSALDAQSEKIVQESLDKASRGRTCIVIAHRLATIRKADMICVLDKGQVAETGTHDQLVELNGLYAQLHALQTLSIDD